MGWFARKKEEPEEEPIIDIPLDKRLQGYRSHPPQGGSVISPPLSPDYTGWTKREVQRHLEQEEKLRIREEKNKKERDVFLEQWKKDHPS